MVFAGSVVYGSGREDLERLILSEFWTISGMGSSKAFAVFVQLSVVIFARLSVVIFSRLSVVVVAQPSVVISALDVAVVRVFLVFFGGGAACRFFFDTDKVALVSSKYLIMPQRTNYS